MIVLILKIILAIFLPPVAALLQVGLGLHFWLNILLTILGVLPGQIHAIWLIVAKNAPSA
ncbi:MAG: YqaE/Pmp3 family membrane protein [Phycisphaerales bacterium JB060]